jgi:hypothetical protein
MDNRAVCGDGCGRVVLFDCFNFSEGFGRSVAIRFAVVKVAISSEAQKATSKIPKIHR